MAQTQPALPHALYPNSSSWLNLIERWFRNLTDERIRRGVFRSVDALITEISSYIDHHNQDPKPFVWTATPERLVQKFRHSRAAVDKMQSV